MEKRDSSLMPYGGADGQLVPSQREPLTKTSEGNPSRYEFSSIIPLDPDQVRQIAQWVKSAFQAIITVGEILTSHPGETTTSLQEDREKTSSGETKISRETTELTEIKGFFNMSIISRLNTTERHESQTTAKEKRTGTQIARTRPGQFLTGGQIGDALRIVEIARGEGLLLLPAVNSELNRQQQAMLSAGRRLVQDYRESNHDWADDIQEGIVYGLIGQLEQASNALVHGYIQNNIKLSENANETINQQLKEILRSSFQHLVEFSLIPTARKSSVEKAAVALRKVVLEEIFTNYPQEAVGLLDKWREIFAREAKGNSAKAIGISFGEILAECISQAQSQGNGIFDDLATVARKTAEEGGAELLLYTFANVAERIPFSERSITFYSSFINNLPKEQGRLKEDAIITTIRFFAATDDKEHLDEHVKGLLDDLTRFKSQAKLILTVDERKFAWSSLAKLIKSLGEKRWQRVKPIIKPDDKKWNTSWVPQKDNEGTIPQSLDVLIDSEIIDAVQSAFAEIVRNAIESSEISKDKFNFNEQGLKDLSYMYQRCDKKTQEKLLSHYIGKSAEVSVSTRDYLLAHREDIYQIMSNKTIVAAAVERKRGGRFGDRAKKEGKIDKEMHSLLKNIYDESFLANSTQQQLNILTDALLKMNSYEEVLLWKSKSISPFVSINAKQIFTEFHRTFKANEFITLKNESFRLFNRREVFGLKEE